MSINLHDLGWNSQWQDRFETFVKEVLSIPPITTSTSPQDELPTRRIGSRVGPYIVGRVTSEERAMYTVSVQGGEILAQVTGKLRYQASGRGDFPAVGDWVVIREAGRFV